MLKLKKITLSLVLLVLAMTMTPLASLQITQQMVTDIGEHVLIVSYPLPQHLQNLSQFKTIQYSLECPDRPEGLLSKLKLETHNGDVNSEWINSVHLEKTAAITIPHGLPNTVTSVEFTLKSLEEIDWNHTTLSVYADDVMLGGWELSEALFKEAELNSLKRIQSKAQTIQLASDPGAPMIIKWTVDGHAVESNDFVSSEPTIVVTARDNQEGISSWAFELFRTNAVNQIAIASINASHNTPQTTTQDLTWTITEPLIQDTYTVRINIRDGNGNTVTQDSVPLRVESGLRLTHALAGPNPYNPRVGAISFQYQLSKPADVELYIYAIDGEQQWVGRYSQNEEGGQAGFNTVSWDGRNGHGEWLANGPYVAYIKARNGEDTSKRKVKFMVLK